MKHFTTQASVTLQKTAGAKQNNNWSDVERYTQYLSQEFIELVSAFNVRDEIGFRDAIADMRVLMDAMESVTTIDMEKDYDEVTTKLLSRFDKTMDDALKTQAKYEALGVKTEIHFDKETKLYVNKVKTTVTGNDGEFYPAGKFLKSYQFSEPVFEPIKGGLNNDTKTVFTEFKNLNSVLKLETADTNK